MSTKVYLYIKLEEVHITLQEFGILLIKNTLLDIQKKLQGLMQEKLH